LAPKQESLEECPKDNNRLAGPDRKKSLIPKGERICSKTVSVRKRRGRSGKYHCRQKRKGGKEIQSYTSQERIGPTIPKTQWGETREKVHAIDRGNKDYRTFLEKEGEEKLRQKKCDKSETIREIPEEKEPPEGDLLAIQKHWGKNTHRRYSRRKEK